MRKPDCRRNIIFLFFTLPVHFFKKKYSFFLQPAFIMQNDRLDYGALIHPYSTGSYFINTLFLSDLMSWLKLIKKIFNKTNEKREIFRPQIEPG